MGTPASRPSAIKHRAAVEVEPVMRDRETPQMSTWLSARCAIVGLVALAACSVEGTAIASSCDMDIRILESRRSGPLALDVIGTPTLCLQAGGDANLGQFTATARITNRGSSPVAVDYRRGVSSAFQSVAYWPEGRRDEATAFAECCGDTQSGRTERKTLAPGETLLVSSWTRHHQAIWSAMKPRLGTTPVSDARRYVVRFSLNLAYDAGAAPVAISEHFDIVLHAVPADAD
ncbi:hypothetical protein [Luteimonas sp. 3794]|uniref:hypothetical protein n=1 Tax=Luteimonas sp. 3794 TaxID=2817730 RepID=UPI00285D2953|nr:hypothetical protein [Luteimonas sp. 3794]MDR6992897.1 hypothetical protein [Luteimonas sp. 3794]